MGYCIVYTKIVSRIYAIFCPVTSVMNFAPQQQEQEDALLNLHLMPATVFFALMSCSNAANGLSLKIFCVEVLNIIPEEPVEELSILHCPITCWQVGDWMSCDLINLSYS